MGKQIFATIEDFYKEAFKYKSSKNMAETIGVGLSTIEGYMRKLKNNNLNDYLTLLDYRKTLFKKNKFDENIFDNLDEESSYWLGMIASDGNVSKRDNVISIYAKITDKDHIDAFKNFLGYSGTIHKGVASARGKKDYPYAYLYIVSQGLKAKLSCYGIIPAKSNLDIDYLSYIPDKYKFAFICGYLDGDGWVSLISVCPKISIMGNDKLLKHAQKTLLDMGIESSLYVKKLGRKFYNKTILTVAKLKSVKKFCEEYIRLDKNFLLKRKQEKIICMLKEFHSGMFHCSCGNIKGGNAKICSDCVQKRAQNKKNTKSLTTKKKNISHELNKECFICGAKIQYRSSLCEKCYKEYKHKNSKCPSKEELEFLIYTESFCAIARKYGVTDNAVRKWCKYYNLPYKVSEIKQLKQNKEID